jgi:hypothetical protein
MALREVGSRVLWYTGRANLAEVYFFAVLVGSPKARRKAALFLMREMYGPEEFACLCEGMASTWCTAELITKESWRAPWRWAR